MEQSRFTMNIDPIENTEEYKKAMAHIQPILDKEFEGLIMCSRPYWHMKKQLLRQYGIEWKSPAELNPCITFD